MTAQTLAVGEHHITYSDDGAGVPVVCIHSGGFTSRQWRRLREALVPGHRVLAPDLLGYGASSRWPDGEPFHYQRDVEALVALVTLVAEPVHLVGHSYGGFLACQVARAVPGVRSLALYEPVTFSVLDPARDAEAITALAVKPTWEPDATGVDTAWLASFVDWWNGPGAWAALPLETTAAFRAIGWKLFEEVRSLAADRTGAAGFATITAPVLLLAGSRSPLTERRTVERLAEALPACTLRILDGLGHMGPLTHHALVDAAIVEHIRAW